MIKLISKTPEDQQEFTAVKNIEMEITSDASLPEVLEAFKQFLLASGYCFNPLSYLEIVDDVTDDTSESMIIIEDDS